MMLSRPFVFENDFDDKLIEMEPVEFPPVPTFSEDELAAAKEMAYMGGIEEGKVLQKKEIDADILQVLTGFEVQLTDFLKNEAQKRQQLQMEAAKLAKTIALKICLTELEKHAVDRVVTCLESTTKMLLSRPQINVSVHPQLAEPLGVCIKQLIKGGDIQVVTDETLTIHDCRFQWQEGGTEVILQNILDQIDTYINQIAD